MQVTNSVFILNLFSRIKMINILKPEHVLSGKFQHTIKLRTKKSCCGYELLTLIVEKIRLMLYFPAPFTMTSISPPQTARSCMS